MEHDTWKTQDFRQSVILALDKVYQRSGVQVARNSSELEDHVFMMANTREEYMRLLAKLILQLREMFPAVPATEQPTVEQERRPSRERRLPSRFKDYVLN